MGKEATSFPELENTMHGYSYEIIESLSSIVTAAQLITSTRTEPVALVIITLRFEPEEESSSTYSTQADHSTSYFLDNIRPLVRKTDLVFLHKHQFYFLLIGADKQGSNIVQQRLWEALLWRIHNVADSEFARPESMSIGCSAYPKPSSTINQLFTAAHKLRQEFNIPHSTPRAKGRVASDSSSQKKEELPRLARKLGVPYLSLLPRTLPTQVQELVSPQLAQELHCYPLGREKNVLTVAMSDPQDNNVLDRLRQETGLSIYPVLAHPQELQTVLALLL